VGRASNRKKVVEMAAVLSIGRDIFGHPAFDVEWHSNEAKSAVDAAAVNIGQSTEEMLRGMAQYLYQTTPARSPLALAMGRNGRPFLQTFIKSY